MASVTQTLESTVRMSSFKPNASNTILEATATRLSYLTTDGHVLTLVGTGFTYGPNPGTGPTGGTLSRTEVTPPNSSNNGMFIIDRSMAVSSLPNDFLVDEDVFWFVLLSGNDTFDLAGAISQPGSIFNGSIVAGDGDGFRGIGGEGGDDTMLLFDAAGDFYGDMVQTSNGSWPTDYAGGNDTITGQAGALFQNVVGDVAQVFGDVMTGGNDTIDVASTGAVYGDVYRMLYGGRFVAGTDDITVRGTEAYLIYGDAYELDDFGEPLTFTGGDDIIDASESSGLLRIYGDLRSTILGSGNGQVGPQFALGNDTITGGQAGDTIYGDLDYLSASVTVRFGQDIINGGAGADTIYGDFGSISGGTNVLLLSGGSDTIAGGAGDDVIYGQFGADILRGGQGADLLDGGTGADRLEGGTGLDTASYATASAGVVVDMSDTASNTGDAAGDSFVSIENLIGSGFDDSLGGDEFANRIDGGEGVDEVRFDAATSGVEVYLNAGFARGGAGRDIIVNVENVTGTQFGDRLVGDAGDNVLSGGAGDDVLKSKGGNDTLLGGAGDDKLRGDAGDETLDGGDGSDLLFGLGGTDVLLGGAGNDFLYGGRDGDTAHGQAGDDLVRGNLGSDLLTGGGGVDRIYGGGSNDTLQGDGGNDYLVGENGADRIEGGTGDDSLTGGLFGAGGDGARDTFVFAPGSGFDRVLDFEVGTDRLDVSDYGLTYAQIEAATQDAGANGANARIDLTNGDTIYLLGVDANALSENDFIV